MGLHQIIPMRVAGVVKIVELSQEFEHCGWRLTQEEQHEVMRYTRSQLPPLLATVVRLLTNVRASLTALNHHTRQQLAQQLVPEVRGVRDEYCNHFMLKIYVFKMGSATVMFRFCIFVVSTVRVFCKEG